MLRMQHLVLGRLPPEVERRVEMVKRCRSYGSHVEYLNYFLNWIKQWQCKKRTEKESSDAEERRGKAKLYIPGLAAELEVRKKKRLVVRILDAGNMAHR